MDNILIACGDTDLLRRIVGDLPDGYRPLATKRGGGIVEKVRERHVPVAIVHRHLEDNAAGPLCQKLKALEEPPAILLLCEDALPEAGPFDRALRYPVPGPVLRNALSKLHRARRGDESDDLERWKAFYQEVKRRLAALAEQTYWEMLGVEHQADHQTVVDAFDQLSLRYHPDRFKQFKDRRWGEALHEKLTRLYTTLTEAYEVLTDRRLRKRYREVRSTGDLRLPPQELSAPDSGPKSLTDAAQTAKARRFLEMAQTEIAKEDYPAAIQNLKFAQSMEPDNAHIKKKIEELEEKVG